MLSTCEQAVHVVVDEASGCSRAAIHRHEASLHMQIRINQYRHQILLFSVHSSHPSYRYVAPTVNEFQEYKKHCSQHLYEIRRKKYCIVQNCVQDQ
jgi:hypothetical protein